MKLLITSVGSLLGQNILDSIESRRNLINVIGMNTIIENPRNFRCDTVYHVNKTDSCNFEKDFITIIEKENPDFILPGRDVDCIFLSDIKSKYPEIFGTKIPFGSSFIPRIMLDKHKSFLFCKKNQLPFADTFLYKNKNSIEGLNTFIEKHGYPLVVKPREGFGSQGVYFVLNKEQVKEATKDDDVLFQEYLGDPKEIFKYKNAFKRGIPLFFQVPEEKHYAAQTIIRPDGSFSEVFFTINTMVFGKNEYIEQLFNKDIEEMTYKFAKVFYKNGWYGPLNIQMKRDQKGNFKVIELSSRHTGSTSARALLGFDEIGILTDIFVSELKIPNLTRAKKVKGQIFKYLQDNLLLDYNTEILKSNKVWKKY